MITRVSPLTPHSPLQPPGELGFPQKFTAWRPAQIQALDCLMASTARFVGIVAPCGFGKALFGMAATRLCPDVERAVYCTSTRGLQDQADRDFRDLGLLDVRGQQNYPCIALEPGSALSRYRNRRKASATCDEGPCHVGVVCHHAPDPKAPHVAPYCAYYNRVWRAQRGDLVSTNYAYWQTAGAYGQGLGEFDLLVCDEAHSAITELERFLVFDLSTEDAGRVQSTLSMALVTTADWQQWGATHHRRLHDRLDYLEKSTPPYSGEDAAERRRLKQLEGKLEQLATLDPEQWVVERDKWRVRFSPLDVRRYAEKFLWRGVPKVICMSATLTEKTLDMLGIPAGEREIFEFPSTFPVARRLVYAFDAAIEVRVSAKMTAQDQELWLERIDTWIDDRRDRKGVIHCVSYDRGRYLVEHSRHRDLMLFHERGDAQLGVDALKAHHGPAILVSPSIMTGIDLPGEECRWQVIAKLPLPDNRGPIMQARIAVDADYSWYVAMQDIEQAVGRGMRAEDDWCETLIADDTWGAWFVRRARAFATQDFLDSIRYVTCCPPPLSPAEDASPADHAIS